MYVCVSVCVCVCVCECAHVRVLRYAYELVYLEMLDTTLWAYLHTHLCVQHPLPELSKLDQFIKELCTCTCKQY